MLDNRNYNSINKHRFFIKRVFKKKKFGSYKFAKIYNISINRSIGFYNYTSPYHLFSKKKSILSPFRYLDYGQNRFESKLSKTFGSYGDFFFTYVLLLFIIFDLYWFKRIFKRSIQREKSIPGQKSFFKNQFKTAYNYDLSWSYEGWEFYDINGVGRYTWWCLQSHLPNYGQTLLEFEKQFELYNQCCNGYDNLWFYKSQLLFLKFIGRSSFCVDDLEFDRTEISIWYRFGGEIDFLETPFFQTLIYPDVQLFPIDWWFYFFM